MTRRRAFTGSPFEARFGFARALRDGNRILVAGTGPIEDDGSSTQGGAAAAMRGVRCGCAVFLSWAFRPSATADKSVTRSRMH